MSAGWIAVRAIVFSYRRGIGKSSPWTRRSFRLVPRLVKNGGRLGIHLGNGKPLDSDSRYSLRQHIHPGLALRGAQLEEL